MGRGRKVGDWKVAKLLCKQLGTTHNNAYQKFLELLAQCGPFASYFAKPDVDTIFFGGEQQYLLILPIDFDRVTTLMESYGIPKALGSPSQRWYSGRTEDGHEEEGDDEVEGDRQGGDPGAAALPDSAGALDVGGNGGDTHEGAGDRADAVNRKGDQLPGELLLIIHKA